MIHSERNLETIERIMDVMFAGLITTLLWTILGHFAWAQGKTALPFNI